MTSTRPARTARQDQRPSSRRPTSAAPRERTPFIARVPVARLFASEHRNYFLLLGTTLFLVAFGLVMVLSASAIESHVDEESFFGEFQRQGLYAVVGIPLMLVASRMPPRFWKRWAWPALVVGVGLLVLVIPLGYAYGGNRNWIDFGAFSFQPSEFVKIALVVWIAWILSTKEHLLGDWKHVALPIGPVALVAIGFVLIGNDLGTATIMIALVLGCMYFAGVKLRYLVATVLVVGLLGTLFAFTSTSRSQRIMVWLNGCTENDASNLCWQVEHGMWALASGGLFGVGLGNSKTKWNWLPEASNDFIFAIIGEELGLVGAAVVLILFIVLAIGFVRVIRAARDNFTRIATGGITIWIIGQAFVNIAVVLGVLPVLGVPLPLISAGGSALIATLLAIGVVLSFARDPEVTAESLDTPRAARRQ
jgi:cell division protein FtsW